MKCWNHTWNISLKPRIKGRPTFPHDNIIFDQILKLNENYDASALLYLIRVLQYLSWWQYEQDNYIQLFLHFHKTFKPNKMVKHKESNVYTKHVVISTKSPTKPNFNIYLKFHWLVPQFAIERIKPQEIDEHSARTSYECVLCECSSRSLRLSKSVLQL